MPPFLTTGRQSNHKPYGEVYTCCKHCEGQNCDPPNQHLSGCALGCGQYTVETIAKASQAEAEADVILSIKQDPPKLTRAQAIERLNWAARIERGRRFW